MVFRTDPFRSPKMASPPAVEHFLARRLLFHGTIAKLSHRVAQRRVSGIRRDPSGFYGY